MDFKENKSLTLILTDATYSGKIPGPCPQVERNTLTSDISSAPQTIHKE